MSPIRIPKSHSGSFTGKFPSQKMNRMIHYESSIEKDFIHLLEFEESVTWYEEQPLRIEYMENKKKHYYIPDFSAVVDGKTWIFECKPKKLVGVQKNLIKFEEAEKYCLNTGENFRVVTDEEIRTGYKLRNIKFLTGYSRGEINPVLVSRILSFFGNTDNACLHDFEKSEKNFSPKEIYPTIFFLIYHHKLSFQVDEELLSKKTVAHLVI
ncbi:TnsA endonuclease N-terminal domain-containing protein [Leptolinea tardivitalis]|uniref:TnsA endonuclease N-terminal domain-containing protein n=1 Tax=Leptolinea tardivitalis TaxID=229920 RepID=UPI00130ECEA4|nr:TnsA endonuclease N-terminal domain-containing protein [Leptolinea tardivitalis]